MTFDYEDPDDCNNFAFGTTNSPRNPVGDFYATEHILELQLVPLFIEQLSDDLGGEEFPKFAPGSSSEGVQSLCDAMRELFWTAPGRDWFSMDGVKRLPIDHMMGVFPSNDNNHVNEFVLLEKEVNEMKKRVSISIYLAICSS